MARIAEDPAERRKALLDAAREMIADGGASSFSMRALAAKTGTSPKSAYDLFGSKEGLLAAILQEYRTAHISRMAEPSADNPLDGIFQAVEISASGISEGFNLFQAVAYQYFSSDGEMMRDLFAAQRRSLIFSLISRLFDNGAEPLMSKEVMADHIDRIYASALFDWLVCGGTAERFIGQFGLGCAIAIKANFPGIYDDILDDRIRLYASKTGDFAKQPD